MGGRGLWASFQQFWPLKPVPVARKRFVLPPITPRHVLLSKFH